MQLTRYHRPIDNGPLRAGDLPPGDRPCGVQVCGKTIATNGALEMRPATRKFVHDAALRALTARVLGGHGDDFGSGQRRFVADHRLKLGEGPSIDLAVPRPAEPLEAVPDAVQVLQLDRGFLSDRLRNDGLRDSMVHVPHPALLPSRQPFQPPLRGRCAYGLEPRPAGRELLSDMHGLATGMERAFGSHGDVVDATINADGADRIRPLAGFVLDDNVDVPLALPVDELGGGRLLAPERLALVRSNDERDTDPAIRGRKGNGLFGFSVGEDAFVVVDASRLELLDSSAFAFRGLDRPRDAGDGADGEVRGKAELFPDLVVDEMLELDLVRCLLADGDAEDGVASQSVFLKGILESVRDGGGRVHLAYDGPLLYHDEKCITYQRNNQGGGASSPRLKPGASAPSKM